MTANATGFLVCVPMLEEWKSGDGIQVIDGWTFQVSFYFPQFVRLLILAVS
jgi:hypothetical protein